MHALGRVVEEAGPGGQPFACITPAAALTALRVMLAGIGVEGASEYRCHDLRRGHALDLQLSGAPLWEILAAGEWKWPAFPDYLDVHELETDLMVQVLNPCFQPFPSCLGGTCSAGAL